MDAIADELDPRFAAVPAFAAGTGLRPEEWIALERRDLDRDNGVITVERVFSQGRLKPCAKTSRQRRRVPYASASRTRSMPSPLVWTRRSCSLPLEAATSTWRSSVTASGRLDFAPPAFPIDGYDLRHTYATWSLAAGVDPVHAFATDGNFARDDRCHLRAPSAGRRRAGARSPQRLGSCGSTVGSVVVDCPQPSHRIKRRDETRVFESRKPIPASRMALIMGASYRPLCGPFSPGSRRTVFVR